MKQEGKWTDRFDESADTCDAERSENGGYTATGECSFSRMSLRCIASAPYLRVCQVLVIVGDSVVVSLARSMERHSREPRAKTRVGLKNVKNVKIFRLRTFVL